MATTFAHQSKKPSRVRFTILIFLFLATVFNYVDRATLSVAAPFMSKELGFDAVTMGWAFSAFGWAYVAMQIPGGWLLDKFGLRSWPGGLVSTHFHAGIRTTLRASLCRAVHPALSDGDGRSSCFPSQQSFKCAVVS